ncbi:hypothetical protein BFN03_02635 [Rhodococcus sp. WMMA185]|uniref:hypothetical protein n=1 Tax=Rhodococcus sp. WMMA185 TaxID=679318 RepID=UPI000878D460|nr:hypothetical protein [Rhodococcus sp. WMMA185]AOW91965.1 hypothetical protein BFN03_02635 [Rhodococcus sp. WMMA185]
MTSFDAADSSEVPEADRVEQNLTIGEDVPDQVGDESSLEVNEADAAEQSRVVPDDEEYPRE